MKANILLFSCLLALSSSFASGLNGAYTIDPGKKASATNYTSFNDADSDLIGGARANGATANGPGVTAKVTFSVADGVYNESVEIGAIKGSSGINTINFESASKDSTKVKISCTTGGTSSFPHFVIHLNKASHINFKEIGMQMIMASTSSYYDHVVIVDNISDSNSFYGCMMVGGFKGPLSNTYFSSIIYSAYNYTTYTNSQDQHNSFINNYLKNGYYGIMWESISGAPEKGNIFDHNVLDSNYYYSMLVQSQENITILNNKINLPFGYYGLYMYSVNYSGGTKAKSSLVANNFISVQSVSGVAGYGISLSDVDQVNIVYNNVNIYNGGTGGSYAAYLSTSSTPKSVRFYNNNFINQNTGTNDYALYAYSMNSEDYNNLKSGGSCVSYGGTTYSTFSNWKKAFSGFAKHDVSVDPLYKSNTDLHVLNPALNGTAKYLTYVTTDIDNEVRDTTAPDIGADEFTPPAVNPVVSAITNPVPGFCTSTQDVYVSVINLGTDTLKSISIEWTVNGAAQTAYKWTGALASTAKTSIKIGSYVFSGSSIYTIEAYPDTSNSTAIIKAAGNTGILKIRAGISGTLTIDNSGKGSPDYTSFGSAINDLALNGVCGAVTYKVADGRYKEALVINSLSGSSSTNTVTFQSASLDSSKVIVDTAITGSVLFINGANYISFREITFLNSLISSYAYSNNVISIGALSGNLTFDNNVMHTSTASTSYGTVFVDNAGTVEKNIVLRNNHISGGNTGISLTGNNYSSPPVAETGNIIYHNIIDSCLGYGIELQDQDGINISGNNILMPSGSIGIYYYNSGLKSKDTTWITNNFISVLGSSGIGLQINSADISNVYFNSVNNNSSNYSAYLYNTSSVKTSNNVMNNIFANYGSGGVLNATSKAITKSDYNDFYGAGSTLAYWYNVNSGVTTTCTNLTQWRTATGKDKNSLSTNPFYKSPSTGDLHLTSYSFALMRKGVSISSVKDDFDGELRNKQPNIGADETKQYASDAGILSIDSPSTKFCFGSKDVYVMLFNAGYDTLKSVTVNWSVNGTIQTAYAWTGSLPTMSSILVDIGSVTFAAGSLKSVRVYSSNPNGNPDSNALNDSSQKIVAPGLGGAYTIGGGSPDFQSFRAAVATLADKGVCGAVTFNVRDGAYNESVLIKDITGASAANTITFQSQSLDSTKVSLDTTWAGSYSLYSYTLRLDGAKYITFRKMKITNTPGNTSSYSDVVELANKANHNILESDIILNDPARNHTSGSAIANDANSIESYNTIRNNFISGGASCINYSRGSGLSANEVGNLIYGNQIDSSWNYAISATFQDGLTISNNRIYTANGSYGIYITDISKADTSFITNNFVTITGLYSSALYSYNCQLLAIDNNSFYINSNNTYYTTCTFYGGSTSGKIILMNNIFSNYSSGMALYGDAYAIAASDYNDIYTTGTTLASWGGTTCTSLAQWKSISKKDNHSISAGPAYKNAAKGDLHLTSLSTAVRHKGIFLADTRNDIDGQPRSTVTSDIGADEKQPDSNDIGASAIVSPVNGGCGSIATRVGVKITNSGLNDQSGFKVYVVINGITAKLKVFSTIHNSLSSLPHDTVVFVSFSPALKTSDGGTFKIRAYTDLVNDADRTNDTATATVSLKLSPQPGFSVANGGACPGNAISISDTSTVSGTGIYKYYFLNPAGVQLDSSTDKNPVFMNSTASVYRVLQVISAGACSDTVSHAVKVFARPVPALNYGSACLGKTTQFRDSSTAGEGTISSYSWDFGNSKTAIVANPSTVYIAGGKYNVRLKIINSYGCSDSIQNIISIDTVHAGFKHTTPTNDGTVSFYANDKTLASYLWDFNDKTLAIDSSAAHRYLNAGSYVVTLTVKNAAGCSASSSSDTIIIHNTGIENAFVNSLRLIIYPNPFIEETYITYTLIKQSHVKVDVYDPMGEKIATFTDNSETTGEHKLYFHNAINPAGIYTLKINIGDIVISRYIVKLQ